MKKPVFRTAAQKAALVKQVSDAVASGTATPSAAKSAGISPGQYYAWKRGDVKRRIKKPASLITIPLAPANQLLILMGEPSQVNAALDRLVQIGVR